MDSTKRGNLKGTGKKKKGGKYGGEMGQSMVSNFVHPALELQRKIRSRDWAE